MLGIDLGSNTLRAVLMNEKFEKLDEFEFIIGAAKNLNESGKIGEEAVQKLRNALRIMSLKLELKNAKAVATAAFRKASNTKEIFADLEKEFGVKFEVIDAKSEAKLSVLGMKAGLLRLGFSHEFGYCDLGGASCELSFGKSFSSFDFGIISFYEKAKNFKVLQSDTKIKKFIKKKYPNFVKKLKDKALKIHFTFLDKKLLNLAFCALKETKQARKKLRNFKTHTFALNSGVPTTLAALKLHLKNYDANLVNGKILHTNDFLNYALKLWNMSEKKASSCVVASMRKNYLSAGCLLLFALFDKQKLVVIDEGLREGVCIASKA